MHPLLTTLLVTLIAGNLLQAQLPNGIVNTQNTDDLPLSPTESLELISVPEGFNVSLFAGEPDVAQPIAINYDDRGRLWVLESFSYIEWKRNGRDRILILRTPTTMGASINEKFSGTRETTPAGFKSAMEACGYVMRQSYFLYRTRTAMMCRTVNLGSYSMAGQPTPNTTFLMD